MTTSKEQFDRQAAHYDAEWNSWSQATLEWMLNSADPRPTDIVLDVATGTGFTALAFASKTAKVIGTDVSTGMLDQATLRAAEQSIENVEFVEAAAESLPFDSDTFDIVTCRIAAHHFVNIAEFAAESYRVVKRAGRLIIADTAVPDNDFLAAVWQNDVERIRDASHGRNYTVNEWRKILGKPGFKIVSISDSGSGIKIPLSSWISKAGCSEEQETEVRRRFEEAPANVRRKFEIVQDDGGEMWFTWLRVLIHASKS